MPFHKMNHPPSAKNIVRMPTDENYDSLPLPHLNLFADGFMYWHRQFDRADRAGKPELRALADRQRNEFRIALAGLLGSDWILGQPNGSLVFRHWYTLSVIAVGFTHFWQQLNTESTAISSVAFGFNPSLVDLCLDYEPEEAESTGIHARIGGVALEQMPFAQPPEGQVEWYEGKDVYVRVVSPAQPTEAFPDSFAGFFQQPFRPEDFVSISPRLKLDAWEAVPPGPIQVFPFPIS